MRLPYDLLSQSYKKPDIYLCDVDKSPMCKLNATGAKGSFKFNAYSEISFETSRTYLDTITGETKVNPFFDKIETPRLIKLDGFGYFEIQGPELSSNGIKESQTVTAYSLEYTLSTKYLENFQINTGAAESVEVGYAYDTYYEQYGDDYINYIAPVTLCNDENNELSLLHLAIEKAFGWKIGHVDDSLKTLSRKFEVDRQSIYDFLMNEVCAKFNCYIVFDTENNTINVYAESKTSKFIGDGVTNQFTISPKFDSINTVSVDGYKTTKWSYNSSTGVITLEDTPISGAHIEIIDGALTEWETDVFVTYENLAHEIKVAYDSDEIKTQLKVTYGDDLDIREANLGIPYLTDLSYYYTVDWMGQDLYDAYTAYMQKSQNSQAEYKKNSEAILDVTNRQSFEETRLSMGYGEASVTPTTVGTYYVRGGSAPNYYYTEVSLPADYDASVQYYKLNGTNINTGKVKKLYEALQKYFNDGSLDDFIDDPEDDSDLTDSFSFMATYKISNLYNDLKVATTKEQKETAVNKFLDEMWNEVGRTPLQKSYKEPYEKQQTQFIDYAKEDHKDYSYYYATVLILDSIKKAIDIRTKKIEQFEKEYQDIQKLNTNIAADLAMDKNFTENQLIRLSAFIREDELQLDDIVETDEDTIADSFKIKEDAIESGRIELHKLSQPKLQFSMTMANIYAIKAFEPIIDQFQLGNVIKVGLRKDYIKQSRLLQVDLEFDNLSSLSTEFGELTNLRTQSDIHADLLGQAISAGKSVAQNSANWTKGSDTATNTDLRIQNGLLDAATVLKSIDGTQGVEMGKYGIKMTKVDPSTGEVNPKQGWIVNNMFAYTDDNWKTTKTVLGEFQLRGESSSRWGLLADAVIAGYVEGSHIIGGDIKIGDIGTNSFPFQVNSDGDMTATSATIKGNSTIAGWNVTDKYIDSTVSNTKKRLYLASASDASTNWICATNSNGANTFYVTKEGKIYAKSGEIGGWTIDADKISGWDDADKCFAKMDKTAIGQSSEYVFGVYNGTNWPFYVNGVGKLHATEATIEGKITTDSITATGGSIKTCTINNCTIDTASIPNLDASKITSGTIDASKITVTNLNASNITAGTLSVSKISGGTNSETITFTGNITCKDIDATGGTIANWTISGNQIYSTVNNYRFRLDSSVGGAENKEWISVYDATNNSWPFYVTGTGKLVAKGVTISGKITATEGEIGGCVISDGKLQVGSANITSVSTSALDASVITTSNFSSKSLTTGNLTVTQGAKIGGFNIGTSYIYLNKSGYATSQNGVYLGNDGIGLGSGTFYVKNDGYLYSTYGHIGGWTINSSYLSASHGQYGVTLSASGVNYGSGTSNYVSASWLQIATAGNNTSDIRLKSDISKFGDDFEEIFNDLKPVKFKYNDSPHRLRLGFIAQDVKATFESNGVDNFGGLFLDYREDGEYYNLIKDDFISLNTWQIQKLKTKVAELENRLAALEQKE